MAASAALVLLHIWIFWDQLASGRLFEAGTVVRWAGGLALCAALEALRRRGVPLWHGRRAFAVWMLVALLHAWSAGAQAPAADLAAGGPVQDASAVMLLPVTAAALAGLTGLLLLACARATLAPQVDAGRFNPVVVRLAPPHWDGRAPVSRGPPLLA